MAFESDKTISTGPGFGPAELTAVVPSKSCSTEPEAGVARQVDADLTYGAQVPDTDPAHSDPFIGKKFSHYTIKSLIGAGGMGAVYLAEQSVPVQRSVALKVLRADASGASSTKRFLAERQALAMMSHTDIAQVYDAGRTDDGHHFFAMELAEGQPIDAFCDERKLGIRERLKLAFRVCSAIEHAHQRGVLHRDIKPGNIIVSDMGDQTKLKVIDFGIAKAFGEHQIAQDAAETKVGQIIGTPAYMSPEQAELRHDAIDQRTDVYSIGIVIYKLLTGTTPLRVETLEGKTLTEVLQTIATIDVERPSTRIRQLDAVSRSELLTRLSTDATFHNHVLRRDLDWLVLKAISVDRNARYSSAAKLGDDILRYLDNKPISAVSGSYVYHVRTFYRRHRTACLAAMVVLSATLGSATVYEQMSRRQEAAMAAVRGEFDTLAAEIERLRASRPDSPSEALQAWELVQRHAENAAALSKQFLPVDSSHARATALRDRLADDQRVLDQILRIQAQARHQSFFDGGTLSLRGIGDDGDSAEALAAYADDDACPAVLRPLLIETHTLRLAAKPRGTGIGVARDEKGYFVSRVHPESAAGRSRKVAVGQRILHVATSIDDMAPRLHRLGPLQVARLLHGPPNDSRTIVVRSKGRKSPEVVDLVCGGEESLELIDTLNRLDDDPWRVKLRFAYADLSGDALRQLSYDPALHRQPLHSFILLAVGLRELNLDADKIRVLREAKQRYSEDALAHQALAESLALESIPRRLEEAARHLTAAIAIDKENANSNFLLARILHEQGKTREAEERYRHVISRQPKAIRPRAYYVTMLQDEGRQGEAEIEYQQLVAEHGASDQLKATMSGVYEHQRFRQRTLSVGESVDNVTLDFLRQQQRGQGGKSGLPNAEELKQKMDKLRRALQR